MGTPYLSEIRIVSFSFPPKGWAYCNGQTLSISQNQALFALMGTTYGGNGTTDFQLPNLQGRSPIHMGNGYGIGQTGGEVNHTLSTAEMPGHTHQAKGVSTIASIVKPAGNVWADSASEPYGTAANAAMKGASVSSQGGGQPHNNMPPFQVMNFVIALQGIFPSRN